MKETCLFNIMELSEIGNHYEKQAYSNIQKILPQKKKWKFSDKNSDIFHNPAQNIDCGYSLEPPVFEQK